MFIDNDLKKILKNIHATRGEFYAFLSRVFSDAPNAELYQMLSDISPKLAIMTESTENEEVITGVSGLFNVMKTRNSLPGTELTAFDLERSRHYTNLFCLPKSIPVDESVYTSPEHQPRGESHDKVIALFAKYRMPKSNTIRENEDFIGFELLFMSKLAYDCIDFIDADKTDDYTEWLNAQYNFHTDHFDKWVYDFYNTVIHYDIEDEVLYKHFAQLARGFMREDKATLAELLSI